VNDDLISFKDLDPAEVLLALHNGTQPLGMGYLHNRPNLTLDEVRAEMAEWEKRDGRKLRFDYYHGRPLKLTLDLDEESFGGRLYDRDAGRGAAQAVIDDLRAARKAG
jgi:hypothetical protein